MAAIVLLGCPCSGKNDLMENLRFKTYPFVCLDMGDILRRRRQSDLLFDQFMGATMDCGDLIPDQTTISIFDRATKELGLNDADASASHWICNGFLRTVSQLKHLISFLDSRGELLESFVVHLVGVSFETASARIENFGVRNERQDDCGGEVVLHRRFGHYHTEMASMLPVIEEAFGDRYIKVSANQPQERVWAEVRLTLGGKGFFVSQTV